ncbi:hypothetical protein Bca4012_083736 [Brassica carinata]
MGKMSLLPSLNNKANKKKDLLLSLLSRLSASYDLKSSISGLLPRGIKLELKSPSPPLCISPPPVSSKSSWLFSKSKSSSF